jgi:hypothetical protein
MPSYFRIQPTAGVGIDGDYEEKSVAEGPATVSKPPDKAQCLQECTAVSTINHGDAQASIMQVQEKSFPQIGLPPTLRKSIYRASDLLQSCDLSVMIQDELGRPISCLQIEVHRQQAAAHSLDRVNPSGHQVGPQHASH